MAPPVRSAAASSPSLFELPAARGPRVARIVIVVTLNLILAGAGIAMIASYLAARADAEEKAKPVGKQAAAPTSAVAPKAAPAPDDTVLAASVGSAVSAEAPAPATPEPAANDAKTKKKPVAASSGARREGGPGDGLTPVDPWPNAGGGGGSGGGEPTIDPAAETQRFRSQIDQLATRHQRQLHGCYRSALKSAEPGRPLEGRVDIRFRIMPDGSARSVRTVANTTDSKVLSGCLVGVVDSWRFPPGASKPLDFVWPFRFRATR